MTYDLSKYTNRSISDYISKVKWEMRTKYPFYGYLISRLKWIATPDVPTAGVDGSRSLYYNEEYFKSLSTDKNELVYQIEVIGIHEVLHLALNHPYRQGHRTVIVESPDGEITVWNIACDIIVNNMIVNNGFNLPDGCIKPHDNEVAFSGIKIENISTKSAEEIYSELVGQFRKNEQKKPKGGHEGKQGNGQGNEQGKIRTDRKIPKPMGNHDRWGEGHENKDSKGRTMKDSWIDSLNRAYEYAKQQGKAPSDMNREFESIGRSKIRWEAFLRREVSKTIPFDYDWCRPNKKYLWQDIFVPSYYGEKVQVTVDIDTSGSMSNKELGTIISELIGIKKTYREVEFRILSHDTEVNTDVFLNEKTEQKLRTLELKGGGGTDHRKMFEYVISKKYARSGRLLITFTDGYTSWPEKPVREFNTLCVLVGGHCPKEQVPDWIKTIVLE